MGHRMLHEKMMHPTQPRAAVCASCSREIVAASSKYVCMYVGTPANVLLFHWLCYSKPLQMTAGLKISN